MRSTFTRTRPRPDAGSTRPAERVARVLAHVDAKLGEALTAESLADLAAMSRHHFHRVFHAHVGCSVGSYVTWRRLQRACALLASGREPVLEIALAVGFESAQSLAKAMRRELDTTPTAVRRGDAAPWTNLMPPTRLTLPGDFIMQPTRFSELPAGLVALTATARGMVDHTMTRSARQAFTELVEAVRPAGLLARVRSVMSIVPDDPQGPDDPHCRYVAGFVFGYAMADGGGAVQRPEVTLTGSLAWQPLVEGRYAVFTHIGPYTTLNLAWTAIYRDWLPASGEQLRDAPPMELCINTPDTTPPEKLHTEIWVPIQAAKPA